MTSLLFREDAYLTTTNASVLSVSEHGGIVFDKSVFYPNSGGQAGDIGEISWLDGNSCAIENTVKTDDGLPMLIASRDQVIPSVGMICKQTLNWTNRYRHMRMHTALHLLSVIIPLPVTGGQITSEKGRLDFDMPDAPDDKQMLEDQLNDLISKDYSITETWISDEELSQNPTLVKTMSVQPPIGTGKVRLVKIGNDSQTIDLQPCGGTHVRKTSEIGSIVFGKIEKKGRQNRRVSIRLADDQNK